MSRAGIWAARSGDQPFERVTEAFNEAGDEFGEERLLQCVGEHLGCATDVLLDRILATVKNFAASATQNDDVTALVLRYSAPKG